MLAALSPPCLPPVVVGHRRSRRVISPPWGPSGHVMSEPWPELIRQTLGGERAAASRLLGSLYPVVQSRVARVLWRTRRSADRSVQQEVEDLTQDVFRHLFDEGGRALQSWDPARGLSLPNFVGLLAERHAVGVLRTDRRNPWTEEPTIDAALDRH